MRLIVPIILIVLAGVMFFGYIDTAYDEVQVLRAEEAEFDKALERSKELVAIRDALLAEYNAIPANDLERLKKLLPNNVDNIRLVLDIDNIASQYGMTIEDIGLALGGVNAGTETGIGPNTDIVGSVILSFSSSAPYDVMKQFIMDLEDSLRIVDLVSVNFSPGQDDIYKYTFQLKTYWLK